MKILVKANPRSKKEKVEQLAQSVPGPGSIPGLLTYKVSFKEPPMNGKANEAILRLLAEHFHTQIYNVRIISGQTSNQKIVEVG